MPGNCSSSVDDPGSTIERRLHAPTTPNPATITNAEGAHANLPDDMHPALKAEHIDGSPPALVDRALSMPFLLATVGKSWPVGDPVAGVEVARALKSVPTNVSLLDDLPYLPKCSDGRALRDLKVWEMAELFIKPATSTGVCSFVQVGLHVQVPFGMNNKRSFFHFVRRLFTKRRCWTLSSLP